MGIAEAVKNDRGADLIMFMGQSNMAGRGEAAESPETLSGRSRGGIPGGQRTGLPLPSGGTVRGMRKPKI